MSLMDVGHPKYWNWSKELALENLFVGARSATLWLGHRVSACGCQSPESPDTR